MTFEHTTFENFQLQHEQDYIIGPSTIAAIMRELPKLELFGLFPALEKLDKKGRPGKTQSTLLDALGLDGNTDSLTLADCVRLTKDKMPAYARAGCAPDNRLDAICGCLSLLSYSYGVSLKKKNLI